MQDLHTGTVIGYLIPEFPGQTHNFFWREKQALRELGVLTCLVSTRRPPRGIVSPTWAHEAAVATTYLLPLLFRDVLRAAALIFRAGPRAWYRCVQITTSTPGMTWFGKLRLLAVIPFGAKLAVVAKMQGWNHVHVHSCGNAANIAMFASLLSPLTYSLTLHNPLKVYGTNQANKWSHARFAIVITRQLYDEVKNTLGRYLPDAVAIAPMGVDVDKFKRLTEYVPYRGDGRLTLFCCGRLNPGKGYIYLIEAIKRLLEAGVSVSLQIAGEDEQGGSGYRHVLEKQIQALGVGDAVTLLGAIAEELVRSQLEKAHAFVLASPEEPLGVVLMEAMAMNVPVIATRAGGVPELVEDSVDGILAAPGDSQAIADSIMRLVNDPNLALRISAAARVKIVASFSHRRSAQVITRLLVNGRNMQRLSPESLA